MKFLGLICTFITIWICAIQITLCRNTDLQPHHGVEIGCGGRRMELNHFMKEVTPMPRPTYVKLIPQRGYTFYPNYASVNRCVGFCPDAKSCLPVKKQLKPVIIRRDSYNSSYLSSQCYQVMVEEHINCKCACSVMEEDCSSFHVYSRDNCACECMYREECDESRQMVWDETMCKCMCNKPVEPCATGREWLQSRCKCVIVMESDTELIEENVIQDIN